MLIDHYSRVAGWLVGELLLLLKFFIDLLFTWAVLLIVILPCRKKGAFLACDAA